MMILRFWFAGPILQKLGPLGLLVTSSVLAIAGLFLLSSASGLFMIFACATLYGFGKTFFWPTMLGVVSEQCPKGGALTLNAIAGIGMLAVGILGGPVIGKLTEDSIKDTIEKSTLEPMKPSPRRTLTSLVNIMQLMVTKSRPSMMPNREKSVN